MAKTTREALFRALSRACDEPLSDDDKRAIEQTLANHPDLVDDYLSFMATEASVEISCGKSSLQLSDATNPSKTRAAVADASPVAEQRRPAVRRAASYDWPKVARAWLPYAMVAATLAVACTWWVYRPAVQVVASDDAKWADGDVPEIGSAVGWGWKELEEGEINLAFRSGAQVAVKAPARFRITSANSSRLDSGTMSAQVPKGASGFVVETPMVRIRDIGTSFRTNVGPGSLFDCHVTSGVVELQQGTAGKQTLVAGDIAMIADAESSLAIHRHASLRTSKSVHFESQHPMSLGYRAFDHADQIYLFLESFRTQLIEDIRVNLATPGQHYRLDATGGRLAAGTVVDSYLLHFSPGGRRKILDGEVTFPAKVVGLLCDSDSLNSTNHLLGSPWTLQCKHVERGLESTPDPNSDIVTLSDDGRTVKFHLRTESIDQMRVLLQAEAATPGEAASP